MAAPALRTRIRVEFPDATLFEIERDLGLEKGDLVPASTVGAFWSFHRKLLVKEKWVTPATDITPAEVRYVVEPISGPSRGPNYDPTIGR